MEIDEEIKGRIREFIDLKYGGNLTFFAKSIGLKPSDIQVMMTDPKRGVTSSFIRALPDSGVNLNWLFTGKSDMMRHDKKIADFDEIKADLNRAEYYIIKLENLIKDSKGGGKNDQ